MGNLAVSKVVNALQAAHEVGINFNDSADIYAVMTGVRKRVRSEIHFGEALATEWINRENFFIQSKWGCLQTRIIKSRDTIHPSLISLRPSMVFSAG